MNDIKIIIYIMPVYLNNRNVTAKAIKWLDITKCPLILDCLVQRNANTFGTKSATDVESVINITHNISDLD